MIIDLRKEGTDTVKLTLIYTMGFYLFVVAALRTTSTGIYELSQSPNL